MKVSESFRSISGKLQTPIGRIFLYCLYFLLVFCFFLYYKLPLDPIFQKYWDSNFSNLPIEIKAEKVRPALLTGLSLCDAEITGKRELAPYFPVKLDKLTVKMPLGSLFGDDRTVKVSAGNLIGGDAEVFYKEAGDGIRIKGKLKKLDLEKYEGLKNLDLGLKGTASGSYELDLKNSSIEKMSGNAKLVIRKGGLSKLKVSGISVPDMTFDEISLDLEIKDGTVNIVKAVVEGEDVSGSVSGNLALRNKILTSVMRLQTNFRLSDKIKQDSTVQLALAFLKEKKDGSYSVTVWGPLQRPRAQLAPFQFKGVGREREKVRER